MKSLESRITDLEDDFVERKEGIHGKDEIRKAVVSFANSLLEDQTAGLFIGVSNDGTAATPARRHLQRSSGISRG